VLHNSHVQEVDLYNLSRNGRDFLTKAYKIKA
jgi:hypothetical protein